MVSATALGLSLLATTVATGQAQTSAAAPQAPPPLPSLAGFLPPYEIARIVRAAGFDPLAPPLRLGRTYVVRATDFRGIMMRVVVDAESGALRAVNRIVPGPARYGPIGMLPPPQDVPLDYGPPEFGGPAPSGDDEPMPGLPAPLPPPATVSIHPAGQPFAAPPPLPRPRPAELASHSAGPSGQPNASAGGAAVAPVPASRGPGRIPPPEPMNE